MKRIRRSHDAVFKAKVALEAVKEEKTMAQIASDYEVHTNLVGQWRKHLLQELPGLFSDLRKKSDQEEEVLRDELYRQIGQLKVEVEWLKKKSLLLGLVKGGR